MNYLKSGEFAEPCGTTKNTLIHYDNIDLLKPAHVAASGYRFYLPSQIYRFASIQELVGAELSLAEIREALASDDVSDLPEVLARYERGIEGRIAELEASLVWIDEITRQAA